MTKNSFKNPLRKGTASPLGPEHGVLDTAAMALKEERKHKHAAPQNTHLWPDGRAINNRTESERCVSILPCRHKPQQHAAPDLLLLRFALSALFTRAVSSKKCHETVHDSVASSLSMTRASEMKRRRRRASCFSRWAAHITNATSGFCHNLQKQQPKKKR